MAKRASLSGLSTLSPLLDNEKDVHDTASSVNHPLLHYQVTLNTDKSPVFSAMKSSGLLSACVPKTHFFPEFISWLVSSIYPGKSFVMNSQGENILQVSTQLMRQALCFPENESPLQFSEDSLVQYFEELSDEEFNRCMSFLIPSPEKAQFEAGKFSLEVFNVQFRPVLSCITEILGRDDDHEIDKAVLGMFTMMMKPGVVLDIPSFWQEVVNSQLIAFPLTGFFRFPSLVVYLFLYQNVEEFMSVGLNIMDCNKNKQSVLFWTDLVRKEENEAGLFEFADHFMTTAYKILNGTFPPCFLPKAQEFLQLGPNCKFGDWFVFEDYSEIRLYGVSIEPYRLPTFVPMRLFALEFIRQSLNVDQVHFLPMKKGLMYKLPMSVGPFVVNTRQAFGEVSKILEGTQLLLGEKWPYDPHGIISQRRVENGYAAFTHVSKPDLEKLANPGGPSSSKTSIQTPAILERMSKRGREDVIDIDDEEPREEKRTKLAEDHSSNSPGFTLQVNEEQDCPSSPNRQELHLKKASSMKQVFTQIEERNQRIKANIEAQAEHSIPTDQTRLLTVMDLEKDQFKMALSHPTIMSLGPSGSFKELNIVMDVKKIPLQDKMNLHMQTGQLIVNDLSKTNATAVKTENMLAKVIKQCKMEKANARALTTQNEELKKIIMKIGVDPNDKAAVQKLMKSAEAEISSLRKKLKLPTTEHSLAAEVAEVEKEKEELRQQLTKKDEELIKVKQTAITLQNQIQNHTCTFDFSAGGADPQAQVVQLNTELKMAERDCKQAQSELATVLKMMQGWEGKANENEQKLQKAEDEIKELKEKLKGNISLIKAKDLIWNEIISEMQSKWDSMNIIAREKNIISEHEKELLSEKQAAIKRSNWAKKFINFINAKTDEELRDMGIQDRYFYAEEVNKMIIKNNLLKVAEKRLQGIKEIIKKFDISFDKLTRTGLPSCWKEEGKIMSWKFYEDQLIFAKSRADGQHEKTQILKGETVFNFLLRHFLLLWMVKTLFTSNLTHSQVVAFTLEYHCYKNAPITQDKLWKECKKFSINTEKEFPAKQPQVAVQPQIVIESATISGTSFPLD